MLPFFEMMQNSAFTTTVQNTWWAGAAINVAHLLALAVFAGGVLLVDLRLLGTGLNQQPVARLAADARPWVLGGLAGMAITGLPQMVTLAVRNYYNFFFWFKMGALLVALVFLFTVRQRAIKADEASSGGFHKVVGLVSITLWTVVTATARMIGLT